MSDVTPCDVPGTSDWVFEQAQMRRDLEIDATHPPSRARRETQP